MHTPPGPDAPIQTLPAAAVYAALASRPAGLSAAEAAARLAEHGPNALREPPGRPLALRLLANFSHLMALLLWAGGAVAFIAQMPQLGVAVWMVNLINGGFSFWQEYRAEQATAALRRMLPSLARALRDGAEQRVPAAELVPGDVILLGEGERVSADARLVQASELRVDQSPLTGESRPVRKAAEPAAGAGARAELPCLIFAGTTCVAGVGTAVVYATGMRTEFGAIARLTQSVGEDLSPLQREMESVTRSVTVIALAVGAAFFALATLVARIDLAQSFIFALGMIVAFVPEGLLPTVTLALAMATQRMARRGALVKRLSAVETLGCTTVICTDKTGTLTQNEMTVRDLWLAGGRLAVAGAGYEPEGAIAAGGDPADLAALLRAAALCNNARLVAPAAAGERWGIIGDPTEAALRVAALKGGLEPDAAAAAWPRWRELPFESRRKRMGTIHRAPDGGLVAFVKGAPREVIELCAYARVGGADVPLDDALRAAALAANDDYARGGLRVLAIAERRLPPLERGAPGDPLAAELVERELTLLGLAAMLDPPRPAVAAAVATCRRAGIRVVMVTGDYGLTAESIARKIGIVAGPQPRIVSGADLEAMGDEELRAALAAEVIFARVAPEQKLRVVAALQAMGNVVAVTGDGVNDAPALKKADIGVAMGLGGTDVAKEAADMILTDDNFASIVSAIEEGRAVYANIKKFTTYIFTSNTPEAVPFIIFALSGGRIPLALNVMHVLAVDLGTDIVPALALGAEPPEPGLMERPPRSLAAHVITRGLLLRAYLWLGMVQSAAAMAAFYLLYWLGGHWGQWLDLPAEGPLYAAATGAALAAVVVCQIGNLFAQRSARVVAWRVPLGANRLLWVGVASELGLLLLILYTPLAGLIGTGPIPPLIWLFLLAWVPAMLLADALWKWLARALRRPARPA